MSVANLTRYTTGLHNDGSYIEVESKTGEWVKFEEAMEASSNSLQQLKAEVAALVAECNVESIKSDDIHFKWLVNRLRQLSAV